MTAPQPVPHPEVIATDPTFIAVHRLVNEVGAARPVVLYDDDSLVMAAPLDSPVAKGHRLALAAPRARFLELGDTALTLDVPGADRSRLLSLAMDVAPDLSGVTVEPGGAMAHAATELAKLAERLPAMIMARVPEGASILAASVSDVTRYRARLAGTFRAVASAEVPLSTGALSTVTAFRNAAGGTLSVGAVGELSDGALVRIHSSCITGDVFGSLKCDCGAQLALALETISANGGALIYTAQEGRGIGLINKLRAYRLQDAGLDTVDANVALGYHDDERDYAAAGSVLRQLGLSRVRLLTNNPAKIEGLERAGVSAEAAPIVSQPTEHNARYLDTKRRRSRHRL